MPIIGQTTNTSDVIKDKAGLGAPEDSFYVNFLLPAEHIPGETSTSRLSLGSVMLKRQNQNQARIIDRLVAEGPETLRNFVDKVLVAEYNPGKGEHVGKHFINVKMKSRQGHLSEIGFLLLEETKRRHVNLIHALAENPDFAQDLLQLSDVDFRDANPKIHEYDF